jgi:hypothetical protein
MDNSNNSNTDTVASVPKTAKIVETASDSTTQLGDLTSVAGSLSQGVMTDSVVRVPRVPGEGLEDFFARPVAIGTYNWTNASTSAEIYPFSVYLQSTRIAAKTATYPLWRGTLHIKAMIATQPQLYGGLRVSYWPMFSNNCFSSNPTTRIEPYPPTTQYLNAANPASLDFTIPFFFPFPWAFTRNKGFGTVDFHISLTDLGLITIVPVATLARADGVAPGTVDVQFYAWMTDVELSGSSYSFQSEYKDRPISRIATAVADVAGNLVTWPIIGPFAKATEIGAGAIASIAHLFGFSRPVNIFAPQETIAHSFGNLAIVSGIDSAAKLSTDPKQELTISPQTVGLPPQEMSSILAMAQQESYLTTISYSTATAANTFLTTWVVDPTCVPGTNTTTHLAWATAPFDMWTGSLVYRFRVFCSPFQRGRLFIIYDPAVGMTYAPTLMASLTPDDLISTNRYCILDLATDTDVEFRVGWCQAQDWAITRRDPYSTFTYNGQRPFNNVLTTGSPTPLTGMVNGAVAVFVDAPLTSPAASTIEIMVTVRAGDDFAVASPNMMRVSGYYFQSLVVDKPVAGGNVAIKQCDLYPSTVNHADLALQYVGERVISARSMSKRYSAINSYGIDSGSARLYRVDRWIFNSRPAVSDASINTITPTWVSWWACTHAGFRGSLRYKITHNIPITSRVQFVVCRKPIDAYYNDPGNTFYKGAEEALPNTLRSGMEGLEIFTGEGCLVIDATSSSAIEFEIPWHSQAKFSPAFPGGNIVNTPQYFAVPGFYVYLIANQFNPSGFTFTVWQAAGEDFVPFNYVAPPRNITTYTQNGFGAITG